MQSRTLTRRQSVFIVPGHERNILLQQVRRAECRRRPVLSSLRNAYEPRGCCPDRGPNITQSSIALLDLSDFVSVSCSDAGSWLWRILDSCGCGNRGRRHLAGRRGSSGHNFWGPQAGGKNEWSSPHGACSSRWRRHHHPADFWFLVVRGVHGKLLVPSDSGQDDLWDEGHRP